MALTVGARGGEGNVQGEKERVWQERCWQAAISFSVKCRARWKPRWHVASAVSTTQTNTNVSVKADLLAYYRVVRQVCAFLHQHLVMKPHATGGWRITEGVSWSRIRRVEGRYAMIRLEQHYTFLVLYFHPCTCLLLLLQSGLWELYRPKREVLWIKFKTELTIKVKLSFSDGLTDTWWVDFGGIIPRRSKSVNNNSDQPSVSHYAL